MGMSKLNVLRCINIPWEFLRINGMAILNIRNTGNVLGKANILSSSGFLLNRLQGEDISIKCLNLEPLMYHMYHKAYFVC